MFEVITEPAEEPVSVEDFKTHMRITQSAEDTLIGTYITAARRQIEALTSTAMVTQTLRQRYNSFGTFLKLPRGPMADVGSLEYDVTLTYVNLQGTTIEEEDFQVDSTVHPPRIIPAYEDDFPDAREVPDAVTVVYTCGYGTADDVPQDLRLAVKLLAASYYVGRDCDQPVPRAVWQLIAEYRPWLG